MCTGREHYLSNGTAHPDNVPSIREIAHSLSNINRFTGHACRAYSVAEHSLLVADMCKSIGTTAWAELCGLMHDAHECITGDVASPIKEELGDTWRAFEDRQQDNLLHAYGLHPQMQQHAALVKFCDLAALATERRDLLPFDARYHAPWPVIDAPDMRREPWSSVALMAPSQVLRTPREWAAKFAERAHALFTQVGTELP